MDIPKWNGMAIPKGMVIPNKNIYQAKEWNGGRNVIPFPHSIPPYQERPRSLNNKFCSTMYLSFTYTLSVPYNINIWYQTGIKIKFVKYKKKKEMIVNDGITCK